MQHLKYLTEKAAKAAARNKLKKADMKATRIDTETTEDGQFTPVIYFTAQPADVSGLEGMKVVVDTGDDPPAETQQAETQAETQQAETQAEATGTEGKEAEATGTEGKTQETAAPATPAAPKKPRRLPAFNFKPEGFVKKLRADSKLDQLVTALRKEGGASEADIKSICTKKDGEAWGMSSITTLVQWDLRHKGYGVETVIVKAATETEPEVRAYRIIEGTPPPPEPEPEKTPEGDGKPPEDGAEGAQATGTEGEQTQAEGAQAEGEQTQAEGAQAEGAQAEGEQAQAEGAQQAETA